jgi:hypothetical protein
VLSRFGYLIVLACLAAFALPTAGSADVNSPNMRLDWSFPETPARTHSDLAMWGNIAVAGNYDGFRVFDITQTGSNRLLVNYLCRGPQNDVSLWRHNGRLLLFQSIDTPQTNGQTTCSQNRSSDTSACGPTCFEGIRIFDLTTPSAPVYLKGVYTDCGSHTHTLVPDLANNRMLIYISSYPGSSGPNCQSPFRKFSIVQVPLDAPETSSVLSQHQIAPPPPPAAAVPGCHDMTAFLAIHLMAASCATEAQLWDITDPAHPGVATPVHIDNSGVNYWHSAEFTWDGRYVVFNDESFTGTCQPNGDGKIRIYRVSDQQLMSTFTIPRPQGSTYCSVHNGNIIPVNGRYLLVAAWYGGGTSVVDFTDPTAPTEIGYYVGTTAPGGRADTWSSYWYNGKIYANDITRGLDVFNMVMPSNPYGSTWTHLNPQTQERLLTPPIRTMTPLARLAVGALAP